VTIAFHCVQRIDDVRLVTAAAAAVPMYTTFAREYILCAALLQLSSYYFYGTHKISRAEARVLVVQHTQCNQGDAYF
jgi:hypothetical protein